MIDYGFLEYLLKTIGANKNKPHWSANDKLIEDCFPGVLVEYPDAILIKQGISQAIAVNKMAKKALYKQLDEMKNKKLRELQEIEVAMGNIQC